MDLLEELVRLSAMVYPVSCFSQEQVASMSKIALHERPPTAPGLQPLRVSGHGFSRAKKYRELRFLAAAGPCAAAVPEARSAAAGSSKAQHK